MNITKRMLRFGAAAVAVAIGCNALADGLGPLPVGESFESHDAGTFATNLTDWASTSEDDASIITNMTYAFEPEGGGVTYPLGISGTTHLKVLKLNTEGGTLSANLNTEQTVFSSQNIYVDTMVNFVVSEDDPSFAEMDDVKIAVFANASSNLVIRHGIFDEIFENLLPTNSVTALVVDPAEWYRLTITLKFMRIDELLTDYPVFQVHLNGTLVEHENDYGTSDWLVSAVDIETTGHDLLTAVSFQGTGFVDDLVVTRTDPFYAPSAFYTVYTVVGDHGSSDAPAVTNIAPGGSLTIVYTADQWYRIGALKKDGAAVEAAAGLATYPQELTNIQADISNNVSFVEATEAQTSLAVPAGWASQFYSTEAAAADDDNIYDDWLLGNLVDPRDTYAFEVSAITVDGNVTVTCKLTNVTDAAPLDTTLNGSLKVYGKVALTDAEWALIGGTTIGQADFNASGEKGVGPFDAGSYNFFRAVIE